MFDPDFCLSVVNKEFKSNLSQPIKAAQMKSKAPRILPRIEAYLEEVPVKTGKFSHFRPARYFHENLPDLSKDISPETKDRFEAAFKDLNRLLTH